jgi:hypothetical protein
MQACTAGYVLTNVTTPKSSLTEDSSYTASGPDSKGNLPLLYWLLFVACLSVRCLATVV